MFSLSVSQGNAVRQSDGAAGVRNGLHLRAAMHTAGGAAGPGQLGREEVRLLHYINAESETDAQSAKILRFVSSSDVLYPKNTCSSHSGVPAEVLCRGRDFVVSLYEF